MIAGFDSDSPHACVVRARARNRFSLPRQVRSMSGPSGASFNHHEANGPCLSQKPKETVLRGKHASCWFGGTWGLQPKAPQSSLPKLGEAGHFVRRSNQVCKSPEIYGPFGREGGGLNTCQHNPGSISGTTHLDRRSYNNIAFTRAWAVSFVCSMPHGAFF